MRKIIKVVFFCLATFFIITTLFLKLINLRTFQFFGEIINRIDTDEKVVALTFDDGPTENTEAVLEMVNKLEIKITFYLIGENIEEYPELSTKIASAGHQIGNHSYSHKRMVFKTPQFVQHEIDATNELIRSIGYKGEVTFRPPYGKKLLYLPYYLNKKNMKTITWDIEPETDPTIVNDKNKIIEYVVGNTKPGSIIILHPQGPNQESRQAIPEIVKKLKAQGYTFVTVNELLKYQKKKF